jgi:hypothetical protein
MVFRSWLLLTLSLALLDRSLQGTKPWLPDLETNSVDVVQEARNVEETE